MARELARILDLPHIELDAIIWQPGWTLLPVEEFRRRAEERLSADAWVVDGNYGGAGVRDIAWTRADTIVWLDYPFGVIFARLLRRTLGRIRDGAELWAGTGNRETVRNSFFSRQSLFIWLLRTYWRRRRANTELFALPQYAHATRLRFRTPREAGAWVDAIRTARRTSFVIPPDARRA